MAGDRRAHAVDRPELGEQLGGGRRVVGDVVDRRAPLGHHGGDAGVALGPHPLGQRLVGDLAHDGAAEAPPPAVDLEQPVGGELVEVGEVEVLAHRLAEPGERADRVRRPEHGGVVDDRPLRRRQLVDAGGDEGAQRSRQVRHRPARGGEPGQLDEEQRVAATPIDEPGDDPFARLVAVAALEDAAHQVGGIVGARAARAAPAARADARRAAATRQSPSGRCPVTSRNGRSDSERTITASWSRSDGSAHCRLSTHSTVIRVWAWRRSMSVSVDGERVAGPGGVEPVERRRVPEQVGDRVEVALQLGVAGLAAPTAPRRARRRCARCRPGRRRDRGGTASTGPATTGAQTLDSPYGAHAVRTTVASPSSGSMISSARRDLPAPASPMIDTTPLWPLRTSCTAASSQRPLVGPPDERHVAADGPGAGGRGAGDEPRLLVLLAPPEAGDAERLAGDRRRAQGGGGAADQHAAGRGQRLQPRRRVDDVAHRRVVGAGQRADEHLAGVDPDAHLDRRLDAGVLDEAAQRLLHPQPGPHGPLGVVLVGDGRAEQGDDGVAEQLVDAPAEQLDVGDQPLEAGLDEALDVLRVAVLGERRCSRRGRRTAR